MMKMINCYFGFSLKFSLKSVLALIFSLFCMTLFAQVNDEFFDVTNTSSESWSGGVYGSGSNTNYSFVIKFKKDVKISFSVAFK